MLRALAVLLVSGLLACAKLGVGHQGEPCNDRGRCLPGLVCSFGRCVPEPEDGGVDGGGDGDQMVCDWRPEGDYDLPVIEHAWSHGYAFYDRQVGNAVAVDSDGKVILAGEFGTRIDLGKGDLDAAGYNDIFIAKYRTGGQIEWAQAFGSNQEETLRSMAVDATGNIYITGSYGDSFTFGEPADSLPHEGGRNVYVAKLSELGGHVWSRGYGNIDDQEAYAIDLDGNGDVLVTGSFEGEVDFDGKVLTSQGGTDVFVIKLSKDGVIQEAISFGDDNNVQEGRALAMGPDDSVYLAGVFRGTLTVGQDVLECDDLADIFLIRLSNDLLSHQWAKSFSDSGQLNDVAHVEKIAVDDTGHSYLAGHFEGTAKFGSDTLVSRMNSDIFLARVDPLGDPQWAKRIGHTGWDKCFALAADPSGQAYLAGCFLNTITLGGCEYTASSTHFDLFLAVFSPQGDNLWADSFGDHEDQIPRDIFVDPYGNVCMTGGNRGKLSFGGDLFTAGGGLEDVFLVKFEEAQ